MVSELTIALLLIYTLGVFSIGWASGAMWGARKALKDLENSYTELRKTYPNEK